MRRDQYNQRMIDDLDVIGCYLITKFYTGIYNIAKGRVESGAASTITDEYRDKVKFYVTGIKGRNDLYMREFRDIHEFFQRHGPVGVMTMVDFENRLLSYFIPPNYLRSFSDTQKDSTLRNIFVNVAAELGDLMVDFNMVKNVIDRRANKEHTSRITENLQTRVVDMFIIQREKYYSDFAKTGAGPKAVTNLSVDVVNKIKESYVEEKRKCINLEADNERAKNIIEALGKKINELEGEITRLRSQAETRPRHIENSYYLSQPISQPTISSTDKQHYQPSISSSDFSGGLDSEFIEEPPKNKIITSVPQRTTPPITASYNPSDEYSLDEAEEDKSRKRRLEQLARERKEKREAEQKTAVENNDEWY